MRLDVNIRSDGGWALYNRLQGAYSIEQHTVQQTVTIGCEPGEAGCTPDTQKYEPEYFSVLVGPPPDSIVHSHGPSADSGELDPNPPPTECPAVPAWPDGADLDANIELAKKKGASSWWNPLKPVYDAKAALWFRDQVNNKGPWDYKQKGKEYQDFGNFNYGATGLALGFDEKTLLREAGRAQQAAGTSKEEWGEPGYRLDPWGGSGSYGDDPDDQEQIKNGFAYYYAKQKGCTWKK